MLFFVLLEVMAAARVKPLPVDDGGGGDIPSGLWDDGEGGGDGMRGGWWEELLFFSVVMLRDGDGEGNASGQRRRGCGWWDAGGCWWLVGPKRLKRLIFVSTTNLSTTGPQVTFTTCLGRSTLPPKHLLPVIPPTQPFSTRLSPHSKSLPIHPSSNLLRTLMPPARLVRSPSIHLALHQDHSSSPTPRSSHQSLPSLL